MEATTLGLEFRGLLAAPIMESQMEEGMETEQKGGF